MPAVELGKLREFITPTYFPWFSYGLVVLYLLAGGAFLLPFAISLRYEEGEKFRCDFPPDTSSRDANDQVTAKCYKKYDERYNSPVPLYGILLLSLASVLVVCIFYFCYMRSRVAPMMNAENVTPRLTCITPLPRLRRVFYIYLLHLVTRLGLMISITAVSFYPSGFPQEFDCVLPGKQQRNSTHFNASDTLSCRTSGTVSRDKANVSRCFWSINIALIFVMLGEIAYLVGRLSCGSEFTVDRKFLMAKYFANRTSTLGYSEHLKQTTLRETEKLERFTVCEEENTIDDMFVDLELEDRYGGVLNHYEELFLPNDTTGDSAKTLIFGLAGTGKSLLCQKLLRDWSKKSQNIFDFAFLFKFRCYNQTESLSLRQLLNPEPPLQSELENVIQQLLDNPEKILLIFDGLDEFRPFLRDHESCGRNDDAYANSSDEKMPVSVLYLKLLQGKLLSGATVLTTSRPHVISRIEISLFEKIVNIKEFTREKVNEYVSNYFKQHPDQVAKIKQHIENNPHLLLLCAIPLYCHTLCHQLMKEVKKVGNSENASSLPTRKTEIYKRALTSAVSKHDSEYRDRSFEEGSDSFSNVVEKALEELGTLARRAIRLNRTTFHQVQNIMTMDFGLLKQIKDDNVSPCFCFIHAHFQDFLAARTIVNSPKLEKNIEDVIRGLNRGNRKWYTVIQFVAGLLNNCPVHEAVKSQLTSCLLDSLSSNDPKDGAMAVLMMKCFYEYNDDNLTKTAMSELQKNSTLSKRIINLKECEVKPFDCAAIVYVLKHLPSGLQYSVDLSGNFIGELGCKELAKLVQSGGPEILDLSNNKIGHEALGVLMKATRSEQSNIRDLRISFDEPERPTN